MNRVIFLLFSIIILVGCTGKKYDPIHGLIIGSSEEVWKSHVDSLLKSNVLFDVDDYSTYRGYMVWGKDSAIVEYSFNKPYEYGILREIEINLRGDTMCHLKTIKDEDSTQKDTIIAYKHYVRAIEPRRKNIIDQIRTHFINLYGVPIFSNDTIKNSYNEFLKRHSSDILPFAFWRHSAQLENGVSIENMFLDVWKYDDYYIEFYREIYDYNNCLDDTVYPDAYILYKSNRYKILLDSIKEEVRKTLTPKDLINIQFRQPEFKFVDKDYYGYYYKISQEIFDIERIGPEEERAITDIRFDIVYFNRFNEELARIRNCEYEFTDGLKPFEHASFFYTIPSQYLVISGIYNNNSEDGAKLELVRENVDASKNSGKVKIAADIKKVVFEDGEVLD